MNKQTATKFGLEPRHLRWHDHVIVRNVNELLHAHRIHGKSHFHLATVDSFFKLAQTTDTAHKFNALVTTEVYNVEQWLQYFV